MLLTTHLFSLGTLPYLVQVRQYDRDGMDCLAITSTAIVILTSPLLPTTCCRLSSGSARHQARFSAISWLLASPRSSRFCSSGALIDHIPSRATTRLQAFSYQQPPTKPHLSPFLNYQQPPTEPHLSPFLSHTHNTATATAPTTAL